MTPRRKLEFVERWYWTCHKVDHRHKTKEIAAKCITATEQVTPTQNLVWTEEMMAACKARHEAGETYAQIGKSFGRSVERVRQVLAKYERKLRYRAAREAEVVEELENSPPQT